MIDRKGKAEALVLANGPSLRGRPWRQVPRDRVFVLGLNQSWREMRTPDAHLALDPQQHWLAGAPEFFREYCRLGRVIHGPGFRYGTELNVWRGPWLDKVTDKVSTGLLKRGCITYCALQLVQDFDRIWLVGFDQTDVKFTGEPSDSAWQGVLFETVPERVKEKIRVIGPSQTKVFPVEGWPWKAAA